MPESITFCGEQFAVVEAMGVMPWMRYAKAAANGIDTDSMEGLTVIYDLLKSAIAEQDWARFEQTAIDGSADSDAMWAVLKDVLEVMAQRPTQRPSDSSDGPLRTPGTSEADLSSRVIGRLEGKGRPDLALVVKQTQEFLAS